MGNRNFFLTPEDEFTFGKHDAMTVAWVMDNDPSYIIWCAENGVVTFEEGVVEACRAAVKVER